MTSSTKRVLLEEQRKLLPIFSARANILREVSENDALIIVGETGSGKTTQIPQFLSEDGPYTRGGMKIAVTQPRRVAAMTIARRVAEEMGTELGRRVGYSVRFEDVTSSETVVKYMTDGMLLREAMLDPALSTYSVVILDEAHERTLHTDILFGLVKGAREIAQRNGGIPPKVIVMSATLDADLFSRYFGGAKVCWVIGRQHPVDVFYTPEPEEDYLDAALTAAMQTHVDQPPGGDILVFLTGQEEIESLEKMLRERAKALPPQSQKLLVCPIFAALPSETQMRVFEKAPDGCRKCILATNIAETSITISGVKYVIDTGVVKARGYSSKIGIETLRVVPISKAQARQRAGRAGREGPGVCFRLYTESKFDELESATVPEIKRCNLSTVVLQLKALGIDDVLRFDYIEPPPTDSLKRALETLYILGGLGKDGKITEIGRKMAQFPLEPQYSKVLIASNEFGCSEDALSTVSMLSVESVFFTSSTKDVGGGKDGSINVDTRRRFANPGGDHLTLLAVFSEYSDLANDQAKRQWCSQHAVNHRTMVKVGNVREQLLQYCSQLGMGLTRCPKDSLDPIRKSFVSGFFTHTVMLRSDSNTYRTMVGNKVVHIHPSSVLFGVKPAPHCVIYNELILTTKPYMRDVLVIEQSWLPEIAPHFFRTRPVAS